WTSHILWVASARHRRVSSMMVRTTNMMSLTPSDKRISLKSGSGRNDGSALRAVLGGWGGSVGRSNGGRRMVGPSPPVLEVKTPAHRLGDATATALQRRLSGDNCSIEAAAATFEVSHHGIPFARSLRFLRLLRPGIAGHGLGRAASGDARGA